MTSTRPRGGEGDGARGSGRRRPGRPPMSAAEVESLRWRLGAAAAEELAERGYARLDTKAIARRAGVSPETFYRHFEHRDACLAMASEAAADSLWDLVAAASTAPGDGSQRLRGAVEAALAYVASEPALARLLGPEAAAAVGAIARARQRLIERLAGLLCAARRLRIETADRLPPATELHLLNGAFALVSERLATGDPGRLPALAAPLAEVLIVLYRDPGPTAALRS